MRPERFAALLFHVGTLNPEWEKLAGPCARCGGTTSKSAPRKKFIALEDAETPLLRRAHAPELKARAQRETKQAGAALRKWRKARTEEPWKLLFREKRALT